MSETTQHLPAALHAPHVEQYFGAMAMHEPTFRAIFDRVARMDLRLHVSEQKIKAEGPDSHGRSYGYPVADNGIAIFNLSGLMMKHVGSMDDGTSTVMLRRTLRAARANNAVAGGILVIDSPGGMCAGTLDLAEDVAAFAKKKPLHVYVDGACCSAAMWVASQAAVISAGPDAIVGSIGTYMPVYDFSKWAENEGISVRIIKAGEHKGDGTPGTEITDAMEMEWQRTIDALNGHFVNAIAKGLAIPPERAKELNDGRVHVGNQAKREGLVHHVENFDAAFARLEKAIDDKRNGRATKPERALDGTTTEPTAVEQSQIDNESVAEAAATDVPPREGADANIPSADPNAAEKGPDMSQQTTTAPTANVSEPKPASMAELKGACPGATSDFLVEQSEKGATLPQAKDAFMQFQAAQIRARDEELTKLKQADAAKPAEQAPVADAGEKKPAAKKPGVPAIASAAAEQGGGGASGGGDAISAFIERRDQLVKDKGLTRAKAVMKIAAEQPDMHEAYVEASAASRTAAK